MNANNHIDVIRRKARTMDKAARFAAEMRNTNRGTQAEQNMKSVVIASMMHNYDLTVREARKLYKAA